MHLASKIFSSISVFSLLRMQLRRLSYQISSLIKGMTCSIILLSLSWLVCLSAKVSLDRLTEFLQKTELLDSFADKPSQGDISTTAECDDIGFNNATFSWSVESPDNNGSSTPSQRTFRLHISGEQLFKRDCINLIIGPTWVFIFLFTTIMIVTNCNHLQWIGKNIYTDGFAWCVRLIFRQSHYS